MEGEVPPDSSPANLGTLDTVILALSFWHSDLDPLVKQIKRVCIEAHFNLKMIDTLRVQIWMEEKQMLDNIKRLLSNLKISSIKIQV